MTKFTFKCTIFRFWGFITRKIAGLVLPDRGKELPDDEADDAAINLLVESSLVDLVYDGHKVFPIPVPCASSKVNIEDKEYENDHLLQEEVNTIQRIMMDKQMNKKKLKEQFPDIAEELKLFYKHCDIRLHYFFF